MPESQMIYLKLLFDRKTGKIYGAQGLGKGVVDKRIDVIATLIKMNGTIYDLYDLELAYQPYFATTEDPNNVLGSQAINILENRLKHVRISKLKDEIAEYEIYDLRGQEAYDKDHIKNAKLLSATDIRDDHKKIPKDKKILIYDENGISASKTCLLYTSPSPRD